MVAEVIGVSAQRRIVNIHVSSYLLYELYGAALRHAYLSGSRKPGVPLTYGKEDGWRRNVGKSKMNQDLLLSAQGQPAGGTGERFRRQGALSSGGCITLE